MKHISKEIQIALVAIAGVAVLFYGMQFLKGLTIFSTEKNYYVKFDDISGLSVSSPIYTNGYKVGVVEDIIFNYEKQSPIVAVVGLDKQLQLPKGSTAEISSDLLGNVRLELMMGQNTTDLLAPGDTINGSKEQGMMGKAAGMVPQIEQMLPKLDSILASINTLLADPAIASSMHNIDKITANLTLTTRELQQISANINKQMPQMLTNADAVLDNANNLTSELNSLNIAATMASVNQTLHNVEQMTAKLNSNESTLGLLMHDPQLYRNLNSTMSHTDSLIIDLKQHPKRYVHFSIFGKKDK